MDDQPRVARRCWTLAPCVCLCLLLLASCSGTSEPVEEEDPSPKALAEPRVTVAVEVAGEDPRLVAARQIMADARYSALITVDEFGQPRARTVDPRQPDESMTVWVATQPQTRKVAQIEGHRQVTLYYFDRGRAEYVTVMGRATLHRDAETIERFWLDEWDEFYPDRPADVVLIEVVPERIEVLGRGVDPDPVTWVPQGIDLSV